jgi:hypothetical protein
MSDWKTTKMRSTLWHEVEVAVEHVKVRNTRKYDSVADFVQKACVMLLDKEGIKAELIA